MKIIVKDALYNNVVDENGVSVELHDLKDVFVLRNDGIRGKIKFSHSGSEYGHGYSINYKKYVFIDENLNINRLEDGQVFTTEQEWVNTATPKEHKGFKGSILFEFSKNQSNFNYLKKK